MRNRRLWKNGKCLLLGIGTAMLLSFQVQAAATENMNPGERVESPAAAGKTDDSYPGENPGEVPVKDNTDAGSAERGSAGAEQKDTQVGDAGAFDDTGEKAPEGDSQTDIDENEKNDGSEAEHAVYIWKQETDGANAGRWYLQPESEQGEKAPQGSYKIGEDCYYIGKDGYLQTGFVTVEESGSQEEETFSAANVEKVLLPAGLYYFTSAGTSPETDALGKMLKSQWAPEQQPGKAAWKWLTESGAAAADLTSVGKSGMQQINGKTYCLNADGTLRKGFQSVSGKTYYFDNATGVRQNYTGWKTIGGKLYYFNASYQMANSSVNGWQKINGKWYWFEKGNAATGWRYINGKWYYMDPATSVMKTGFFTAADGKRYYCDASGAMATGGWNLLGGKWYWMQNSGAITTGWIRPNGTWYYLTADGSMATGWYQVNGTWYYSDGSGAMLTGWIKPGNTWYYLTESGAMLTGWGYIGGKWYYLTPGEGGMKTSWYQVNGTWYYSDGSGAMLTGWIKPGNTWYYLTGSGAMLTGWGYIGGKWYYLTPGEGGMKTGWYQVNGTWYYSDASGAMAANRWIGNYYVTGSGAMAVNTWIGPYYVGADGNWRPGYDPDLTGGGWIRSGSSWYFQRENGSRLSNMWKKINGVWYWFASDGVMATGWKYIGGYKYYFNSSGALVQDVDSLIGRQSSYYITVDRVKCQVTVYARDGGNGYIIPVKTFACSVGLPGTPTPTGTFNTMAKYRIASLMGPSWGKWGTRIVGGILFHSVACPSTNPTYTLPAAEYNRLGSPASHGCVRLTVRDAKWIYDNCALGTTVRIGDNIYAPFDKPATIKIPASQTWDPTDPEA